MTQSVFTVEITYFKSSGKLYVKETFNGQFTMLPGGSCYMNDVVDYVRDLRNRRRLPGLQSGYWDGYILVDCENGYPCLIVPSGNKLD